MRANSFLKLSLSVVFLFGSSLWAQPALAAKKQIVIGYQNTFNPWKVAIVDKTFERATGYSIKWRRYTSGFKTLKPLANGKIQMAMAGSVPIAAAVSGGMNIELFWIVEDIGAAEALVVRNGSGVISPSHLNGKRIGVPIGSTSHYHTLFALEQFGIDQKAVKVLNMQPSSIRVAWQTKTIDAAFIWDPILSHIKQTGKVLVTSGQLSEWGKATFDGLIVNKTWAANNARFMVDFVRAIAAADAAYTTNPGAWTTTSEPVNKIAALTGGDPRDVPRTLALYNFLNLEQQASKKWLGGGADAGAAKALRQTAKYLVAQKKVRTLLPSYDKAVTDRWVRLAMER